MTEAGNNHEEVEGLGAQTLSANRAATSPAVLVLSRFKRCTALHSARYVDTRSPQFERHDDRSSVFKLLQSGGHPAPGDKSSDRRSPITRKRSASRAASSNVKRRGMDVRSTVATEV